jgi:hypothetical protein
VITTFLGFGMLSLFCPLPPDRMFLLNPGQTLDVGDRTLLAVKPPTFDNPATTAVFDAKPDVLNHNVETVPRLYRMARSGGRYDRTLQLLERSHATHEPTEISPPRTSEDIAGAPIAVAT